MKKIVFLIIFCSLNLFSTPSNIIFIPATETHGVGNPHLDVDNYFQVGEEGSVLTNFGFAMGFFPFKYLKLEGGVDYRANEKDPLYFHGKLLIPQSDLPAFAFGIFNIGLSSETLKPIYYFLIGYKQLKIGRFQVGYYIGDKETLRDSDGEADNKGILASFDRDINELSRNLSIGVDYFMGENLLSSVNFGLGWRFAQNVKLKISYHIMLEENSENHLSFQVDIDTF